MSLVIGRYVVVGLLCKIARVERHVSDHVFSITSPVPFTCMFKFISSCSGNEDIVNVTHYYESTRTSFSGL